MKIFLHHVQHLFLDLFQLIFHLHDDFLHFGVVGLAAKRIDFTSHFLSDESELFALSVTAFQCADKVFQVIGKTLFSSLTSSFSM